MANPAAQLACTLNYVAATLDGKTKTKTPKNKLACDADRTKWLSPRYSETLLRSMLFHSLVATLALIPRLGQKNPHQKIGVLRLCGEVGKFFPKTERNSVAEGPPTRPCSWKTVPRIGKNKNPIPPKNHVLNAEQPIKRSIPG
jgi:hypothetical protein